MIKKISMILFSMLFVLGFNTMAYCEEDVFADDVIEETSEDIVNEEVFDDEGEQDAQTADEISSAALNDYDASGSLFEKITTLEQEKIVIQLEKERAQLDLELDRLNAERIKLQMEMDTLSGRAEQQQQELEAAKTQLEIQTEKLRRQKDNMDKENDEQPEPVVKAQPKYEESDISKRYKLINVVGVDNQLQATIEELSTGQNKRIAVGKELDGYVIKSISLNDGIIFEKDGNEESLNIGK